MHLAETTAELELLANSAGEFVPFLQSLGVWREDVVPRGSQTLDYLKVLALAPRVLVIHGNYLDAVDIEFLVSHPNFSVVYCPRTHAYFGHPPHPWRQLLSRGVNVALGTDSRASNPDLSLFNELKFVRQLAPEFDPGELLRLGTLNGAFALGIEAETGSLELGKSADLAIVDLPVSDASDPYASLFDVGSRISATICQGVLA
jgi:cytosine/adenosine deaminase-related metal-dependent hydrolase